MSEQERLQMLRYYQEQYRHYIALAKNAKRMIEHLSGVHGIIDAEQPARQVGPVEFKSQ